MRNFNYYIICLSILIFSCSSENNSVDEITPVLVVDDFIEHVNEDLSSNTFLGNIDAQSTLGSISYSIISQDPLGAISINTNGRLEVANSALFDFEFFPIIEGEIEVTSGDLTKIISFTFNLIDIEESSSIKYENERYSLNKLREFPSNGLNSIYIGSSGVEFYADSGIRDIGDLINFEYNDVTTFNNGVWEGEMLFNESNNDLGVEVVLARNEDFESDWWTANRKTIKEGKLIYKRVDIGNTVNGYGIIYHYELSFLFKLVDDSIITGSYIGEGRSD